MGFLHLVRGTCGVLAFLLTMAPWILASPVHARESTHRVFLLDGLSATDSSVRGIADVIKMRLKKRSSASIDVYSDFLDLDRFGGPANEDRLVEFLTARFAQVRPDVVIPVGRRGVEFVVRHGDAFIGGIPVVYCCTPAELTGAQHIPPGTRGIELAYDWVGTFALAQRLQPNARRVVIISADTGNNLTRDGEAMKALMPLLHKYDVRYLTGLAQGELLKEVTQLPRDSIVLLRSISTIGGRADSADLAYDIANLSTAPVYSTHATYFGTGIVGGRMDSFKAEGMKAADLALDMMSGKQPSGLLQPIQLPLETRIDARALTRWGFAKNAVPREASVEFLEPTLWEQYRTAVSLVLIGFIALGGIIACLMVQGSRLRAAKKLLKESEERIAFAAAAVNIGIWRMEIASSHLWATGHCRMMFGVDAATPLTWDVFRDAVHPDDRHIFDEWLRSLLPWARPAGTEFRIVLPGDSARWYLSRQYTLSDGDSQPLQVCGVFVDVTQRKLAEEQAHTQREELAHLMRVLTLGELSSGIAHELSQPLAAILANAQAAQVVLARTHQGDDLFAEIVDDVVRDVHRAAQVVDGLRRLLKKARCQTIQINLNDLVRSTLPLINSELVARRIRIETELESDLPPICCDRVQMQQLILNLMMNAMDAMGSIPAQSRLLRVATRTVGGGGVELSILDHGPGISPENFKRLFEPFFTTKQHGLGLGLSICSTIVRSHHGRLNISNADAGGTVAVVSLPAAIQLAKAS